MRVCMLCKLCAKRCPTISGKFMPAISAGVEPFEKMAGPPPLPPPVDTPPDDEPKDEPKAAVPLPVTVHRKNAWRLGYQCMVFLYVFAKVIAPF